MRVVLLLFALALASQAHAQPLQTRPGTATSTPVTIVQPSGPIRVAVDTAPAVTGTITVIQPSGANLHVVVDSMPALTGTFAATQSGTWTVQPGNTANTTAWLVTGTGGTFPVTGSFLTDAQLRATPVPVSGTVTVTDGAGALTVDGTVAISGSVAVTGTFWQATQPVSIAATVPTKETRSATPTQSSVAGSASSVSCLAANANRLGATIHNDSAAVLRVKLGATASSTSFTARLIENGYYELPFHYTGAVDCIWESATGSARITELGA